MMADRMSEKRLENMALSSRTPTEAMEALAKEARQRVEHSLAKTAKFREQRRSDMEFVEFQYRDEDVASRKEGRKPAMQVHTLFERIQEVMNKYRESGLGFRIGSATSETGDDAAKAFNGLAQRDQRDSLSESEMERVVLDATYYGEGWGTWDQVSEEGYVRTVAEYRDGAMQFSDEADLGLFDRRLRLRACDPENIYEDPSDSSPDRHKMRYLVETEQITLEERNARYPKASKLPDNVFEGGDTWFPSNAGDSSGARRDKLVVLARYYRRRVEQVTYVWHPTFGQKVIREDRLTLEQKAVVTQDPMRVRRTVDEAPVVELIVTDGMFVLEGPTILPWSRIPYFRAVGSEEKLKDGERIKRGLVYRLRDMCAAMSVGMSDLMWKLSIVMPPGWIAPADAIMGHREDWRDTTRPRSVRQYDQYSRVPGSDGTPQPLNAPTFESPSPNLTGIVEMISVSREMLGASAGSADPPTRETESQYRSGVAMDRLERMRAAQFSLYIWHAEKVAMQSSAEVWLDKARYTYDRIGRKLIVAGDSPSKPDEGWLVGVPFIRHPVTGELMPVPDVTPDMMQYPLPGMEGRTTKIYRFNPATDAVKVTTHAQSLNAAGNDAYAEALGRMAEVTDMPPVKMALLKDALHSQADRWPVNNLLKELDAISPPMADMEDTDITALPAQMKMLQAENAQLKQVLEETQAAADQNQAAREIASEKAAADVAKTQMQGETQKDITAMKIAADADKTEKTLEQKSDQAALQAGVQLEVEEAKETAAAHLKGLELGAEAGRADADRKAAESKPAAKKGD